MSSSIKKLAKTINPDDFNQTEPVFKVSESAVEWNNNIKYFTYFSTGIGIINIILILINWKKIKNSILLLIISIISAIFQWISMWINTRSEIELLTGISKQASLEFIIKFIFLIIPFIIQIIIFIKLIMNIRKNKKEGGKL